MKTCKGRLSLHTNVNFISYHSSTLSFKSLGRQLFMHSTSSRHTFEAFMANPQMLGLCIFLFLIVVFDHRGLDIEVEVWIQEVIIVAYPPLHCCRSLLLWAKMTFRKFRSSVSFFIYLFFPFVETTIKIQDINKELYTREKLRK